ncbi:MAG TPA: lipoate--protein ligase family protein [Armatimonadota bacterium]
MTNWRLLLPVDGPGALHMAADVAILEAIRAGQSPPVLRFYRWTPPCVTLGKFQPAEGNVQLDNCARLGVDVARRPTGGRAILHDREVTFSIIIAERDLPGAGGSVMESYRALGAALVDGLCRLGLPAELVDRQATARAGDPLSVMAAGNPACFAAKARCDLMIAGKKIIGSAQMRTGGIILQQNSLPLEIDFPKWDEVFFRSDWEAVARSGAIGLCTAAGRTISEDEVVTALCAGFTSALGVTWQESTFTPDEEARARELLPEYAVLTNSPLLPA